MEKRISILLFVIVASLAAYMTWRVSKLKSQVSEATATLEAVSQEAERKKQEAIQFATEAYAATQMKKMVDAGLEQCAGK